MASNSKIAYYSPLLLFCMVKETNHKHIFLKPRKNPQKIFQKLANRKIFSFQGSRTVYKTIQKIIKKTFDVFTIYHAVT